MTPLQALAHVSVLALLWTACGYALACLRGALIGARREGWA